MSTQPVFYYHAHALPGVFCIQPRWQPHLQAWGGRAAFASYTSQYDVRKSRTRLENDTHEWSRVRVIDDVILP